MVLNRSRKTLLAAAAAAIALGAGAPAMAGGGYYYGHAGYYSGHGKHYYGHHRYRRHHYRRHHRHGGGGKAAAIALGVIGGAIIINELAESRARDRYSRDRYYDARYARPAYPARPAAPAYPDRGYDYEDDYDAGPQDGSLSEDEIDQRLDGGPEPIRYSAQGAYNACIVHARAALSERGYILAGPAEPETAEDMGDAWKMTANIMAQRGGDSWSRAMYCEADEGRVYVLELI